MVYKDRFVAVIKCDGKVLREKNNTVTLPFGSEYSLLLKNLESRKAIVKVTIDGQDVVDGALVIDPNSECELEGFLKGMTVKNKFKFIQKTEDIVKHRGDRVDDGIVRVEYRFEKKVEEEIIYRRRYRPYWPYCPPWTFVCWTCGCEPCTCPPYRYYYSGGTSTSESKSQSTDYTFTNSDGETQNGTFQQSGDVQIMNCSMPAGETRTAGFNSQDIIKENAKPTEDEGITVPGSHSGQVFSRGHHRQLEENSHIITIKLTGTKADATPVKKPVTTKTKVECSTCGTKSKSSADYCSKCGTALF